jgi:hypothetical protein
MNEGVKHMKKTMFLVFLMFLTLISGQSLAQEDYIELSVPEGMPDNYVSYHWIGGAETNGATFVINAITYNEYVLKIHVLQLPNDNYTALIDNQVDGDPLLESSIKTALKHGSKVLGTLCDVLSVTDQEGNNILCEYSISSDRKGSALSNEIRIFLPAESAKGKLDVLLVFGVNEDLSSIFPMSDSIELSVVLAEESSVKLVEKHISKV